MPELEEAANTPLEAQDNQEQVEAEASSAPPVEKEPGNVPYRVFAEANARMQAAEQRVHDMQMAILQLQQQQIMAQQASQAKDPDVDPDVEALIAPVLHKRLTPLQRELELVKQREAALLAERQAKAAWDYVRDNVPDLDDLGPAIQEYLSGLSPERQNKITSDPDLVIQTAELVRERVASGKALSQKAAKADMKARTKGESGAASIPSKSTNTPRDWSSMSDAEFREHERKLGIRS
jgi:hypothetical protein